MKSEIGSGKKSMIKSKFITKTLSIASLSLLLTQVAMAAGDIPEINSNAIYREFIKQIYREGVSP